MSDLLRNHSPVWIIQLGFILLVSVFALRTPDWQSPDEPAHYQYVAQMADGHLPVIETGDWDGPALDAYKANQFDDVTPAEIQRIEYEDHQPPLYYALMAPVYRVSGGDLTVLRLVSGVVWGSLILWATYGMGRVLLPARPWVAAGAAGIVAFQPMHLHILASVNNDALAWALMAVGLLLVVAYMRRVPLFGRQVPAVGLGLVVGLGFVTKATTYPLAGVAGVAVLLRWWLDDDERTVGQLARQVSAYLIPALLLGALWWGRNMAVYGVPDFLGLAAHDAVVRDQPRTAERIDLLGWGGYLREIGRTTFNSFWGQFGWMALPMRDAWYAVIAGGVLAGLAGLGLYGWQVRNQAADRARTWAWGLLALTVGLAVLAYAYYNSEFQQYQGRYMFTALAPLAVWLALGAEGWRLTAVSLIRRRRDEAPGWVQRGSQWAVAMAALPLAGLAAYVIWRVIPGGL